MSKVSVPAGNLQAWRVEENSRCGCGDPKHEVWFFADGRGPVLVELTISTAALGSTATLKLVSTTAAGH